MVEEKTKRFIKRSLPRGVKISIEASQAKKGEDLIVLDLRGISSFTDFFVIMHGNSPRQNAALYESIEKELKNENIKPLSIEGKKHAEWVLMDYGYFIIHIFSKKARDYYSLEKLWGDASKLSV
ncbi:MAG: ribosome silencing factor [Candidatus Aminicenantes bacterium]|nr:MAG: ribosome silencing factor [Candidatus Aminicenantes bacterium]